MQHNWLTNQVFHKNLRLCCSGPITGLGGATTTSHPALSVSWRKGGARTKPRRPPTSPGFSASFPNPAASPSPDFWCVWGGLGFGGGGGVASRGDSAARMVFCEGMRGTSFGTGMGWEWAVWWRVSVDSAGHPCSLHLAPCLFASRATERGGSGAGEAQSTPQLYGIWFSFSISLVELCWVDEVERRGGCAHAAMHDSGDEVRGGGGFRRSWGVELEGRVCCPSPGLHAERPQLISLVLSRKVIGVW